MKNKEIMTSKEVAEYLSLHPLTVHKYARKGVLPSFKIGTDWRFQKKDIDKWIKDKVEYNSNHRERRKSFNKTNNI